MFSLGNWYWIWTLGLVSACSECCHNTALLRLKHLLCLCISVLMDDVWVGCCSKILCFLYNLLWDNLFFFWGAFWRRDRKTVGGSLLFRILYWFLDQVLSNSALVLSCCVKYTEQKLHTTKTNGRIVGSGLHPAFPWIKYRLSSIYLLFHWCERSCTVES